jgi:hypothetical protein
MTCAEIVRAYAGDGDDFLFYFYLLGLSTIVTMFLTSSGYMFVGIKTIAQQI